MINFLQQSNLKDGIPIVCIFLNMLEYSHMSSLINNARDLQKTKVKDCNCASLEDLIGKNSVSFPGIAVLLVT